MQSRHPISRTEYDALESVLLKAEDQLRKALEDAADEMRGWSDIAAKAQYAASIEGLKHQITRAKSRLDVVFPDDDLEQMRAYQQDTNDKPNGIGKAGRETIGIGSRVEIEFDGDTESYRIVSESEARPSAGLLSDSSPIGRALIGKRAGQRVQAKTPSGIQKFTILHVD